MPCDHRYWGVGDHRQTRRRRTAQKEVELTTRFASGVRRDHSRHEEGAGKVTCHTKMHTTEPLYNLVRHRDANILTVI